MKTILITVITVITVICMCFVSSVAAAPFRNLDFEEADTNGVVLTPQSFWVGTTEALLPGWNLTLGSEVITNVYLPSSKASPFDKAALVRKDLNPDLPIQGRYGLLLDNNSYPVGYPDTPYMVQLSQTGDVPVGASELWFTGLGQFPKLRINGQPANQYGDGRYIVESFSGQTVELIFELNTDFITEFGLDNIEFKIIPEPRVWLMLVCGIAALLAARLARDAQER